MELKNYSLSTNGVRLFLANGATKFIFFNEESGEVYARTQVQGINEVQYPGIYLGSDIDGNEYMIHNNIRTGVAEVVTLKEFAQRQKLSYYHFDYLEELMEVAELALNKVISSERFHFANYSRKTAANETAAGQKKSEVVTKWAKSMFSGVLNSLLF